MRRLGMGRRRGQGTGSSGPTDPAYWRIGGLQVATTIFEVSEIQLYVGAVNVNGNATKSATYPEAADQAFSKLFDGSLLTRSYWTGNVAEAADFYVIWHFPAGALVDGVKMGGWDTAGRYPTDFTLQYSDDGVSYTTAFSKTGLTYPGNNTLSALYTA